ncbi:MAG: hypothetical protein ACI8O8_001209 [Oleiphilaceae bacterium]|jgi:hypothetical protein
MKHKEKNTMPQAEQKSSTNNSQPTKTSSWEMSPQDALRVDYVTRKRSLTR